MTKLIVDELGRGTSTYLQQKITIGARPMIIVAIRPKIYKHNNPAGSLKMEIRDASQNLLAESNTVTIQSLTDVTNAFAHGYFQFDVNVGFAANTDYYVRMVSTGYTFAENAFVGWCRGFELGKYEELFSYGGGLASAFDFEAWENKNLSKGVI